MQHDDTAPVYADSAGWQSYKHILADRFGIAVLHEPEEHWLDWRGHRIHLDVHEPQEPQRGTLVLVHGAGGHGRLLAPLGNFAASLGWRAIAPDLPGYGITKVKPGWREDYSEWPACIADLARSATGPVVLMGLSVGGITAIRAAQLAPRVSGVIATTLIDLSDQQTFVSAARWRWLGHVSLFSMRWLPWLFDRLPLPLALATPLKEMTTDPVLAQWFMREPLIGRRIVRGRFFRSLHQYRPAKPDLALSCPLLLVHPGADAWTPTAMSLPAYESVPGPKRLRVLTNGAHLPVEAPAWSELCAEIGGFLGSLPE